MKKRKKEKNPRKRCTICHVWYTPDARTRRHQACCKKPSCRKKRRKRTNKSWQIRHSGYDKSRNRKKQAWAHGYPGYWRSYRQDNPAYVMRDNRRRKKSRDRVKNAANQDAIDKISVEELTSIPRWRPKNAANQDVMDRRVDTVVSWLVGQMRAANQAGMELRLPGMR